MKTKRLKNFLPSLNGFHFGNQFKSHLTMFFIDDAAGMCGGMVFAARDYHEHQLLPPTRHQVPTQNDDKPLLDYIRQRQWESAVQVPSLNYFLGSLFSAQKFCESVCQTYEAIKQSIDANHLAVLGLIRTQNVLQITLNHQVGVYGYDEDDEGNVTLFLYDSKYPDRNDITIAFNLSHLKPQHWQNNATPIRCNPSELGPIYMFFQPIYNLKYPIGGTPLVEVSSVSERSPHPDM